VPRLDLTPDPSAPGAATLEADGAIIGPFGSGLLLLFSERFRFVTGRDTRRRGLRHLPHPLGRALVSGRRCLPWMHHPYVPHAILEREDDQCEWLMVMGTFGPGSDWGDGTEANFPQYGVRRAAADRRGRIWEEGVALELALEHEGGGELRLSDLDWQVRQRPGLLELVAVEAGPLRRVRIAAPAGERCGRIRLEWARRAPPVTVVARARFLARRLTVAPAGHEGAIDVLAAPFGFQRFEELLLTPRATATGAAFDVPAAGVTLFLASGSAARARWRAVDPHARAHAAPCDDGTELPASAACFDVRLAAPREGGQLVTDLAFGVEEWRDPSRTIATALQAPIDGGVRDLEGADGGLALRLDSGDRWLDGLLRWSRSVAHALVAPNGVVMTGALGYSAKSHVGQDVPFVLPLLLLDPHPRLRGAARRMIEWVIGSPSASAGRGILDHPCEGQDFAFLPMRPRTARLFRPVGAAGLFRWILVVERAFAATGEREPARRALDLFAAKVEHHYLPFTPANDCWSAGEETQEPAYALPAAFDGLGALLRLADALDPPRARRLSAPIEEARAAIAAQVARPVEEGGLRLAHARSRGGVSLDRGWFVSRAALERDPPWFGFDAPLTAAHALLHGALSGDHADRLVDLLADRAGPFRVAGAGLSKSPGGAKGVWFWHNALAAKALARAGRIDAAHELFGWMARGVADVNGLGIPGEETNGGDYAMGIGALAGLCLVESLLGLELKGGKVSIRPALPAALERVVVAGLTLRERAWRIEVRRRVAGPLRAPAAIELDPRGEPPMPAASPMRTMVVELG